MAAVYFSIASLNRFSVQAKVSSSSFSFLYERIFQYVRPKRTLASALIWSALSLFSSEVIGKGERRGTLRKEKECVSKSNGSKIWATSGWNYTQWHSDTHTLIHHQSLSFTLLSIDDLHNYHPIHPINMSTKKLIGDTLEMRDARVGWAYDPFFVRWTNAIMQSAFQPPPVGNNRCNKRTKLFFSLFPTFYTL